MFKLRWRHLTKFNDVLVAKGGHHTFQFGTPGQMFKLGSGHHTKMYDVLKTEGGTPHIPIWDIW